MVSFRNENHPINNSNYFSSFLFNLIFRKHTTGNLSLVSLCHVLSSHIFCIMYEKRKKEKIYRKSHEENEERRRGAEKKVHKGDGNGDVPE